MARTDQVGIAVPNTAVFGLSQAATTTYMQRVKDSGAGWLRFDMPASDLEVTAGNRNWSAPDRVITTAVAAGLKVCVCLSTVPAWARSSTPATWERGAITSQERDAYTAFGVAAIQRYPQVGAWEIWNEPNYAVFWQPTPTDSTAYQALLAVAYPQFRAAAAPSVPILSGGTAWVDSAGAGVESRAWYSQLYAAGAGQYFDAVGMHPYPNIGWSRGSGAYFTGQEMGFVADVRATMNAAGDVGKQIWGTECGFPTLDDGISVTEAEQAAWLPPVYDGWVSQSTPRGATGPLFWYELQDQDGTSREGSFGLIRTDGTEKPAYGAMRTWVGNDPTESGDDPLTVLFNQPMTGPQGATITTGTLAAAGDTPDLFQNPAPAVWFYDNGMGKLEANSTASYLQENVNFTDGQDCTVYVGTWRGSTPPSTMYLLRLNNGGSLVARLSLGTDGIMKMYSAAGTEWTGTTPVPLDRKVIHGFRVRLGATTATGELEYRRWEATAGAPTVTPNVLAAPAAQVTVPVAVGTTITRVQFGNTAASNTASTWFHSLRILDGWDTATVDVTAPAQVTVGSTVTMTATGDPSGGTYSWARTGGDAPTVTLSGAATATASFTAPTAAGTTATFTVTYTPPASSPVTRTVSVQFRAGAKPVVVFTRTDGTVINATGTAGTVRLVQVEGSAAAVTESPAKVFTIDTTGVTGEELTFQLITNDGVQDSDPAVITVSPGGGTVRVSAERYWDAVSSTWKPTRV